MKFDEQTITTLMETVIPFNRFMGIRISRVRDGFARMELPFREEFIGDPVRPALHGGVITTLIDTCGGAAVWSAADPGDRVSTVDLRVDYLLPGPLEDLACEARVLRIGNRVGVADMRVFAIGSPDRTIASGKGVYNVRRSE
ncbi:MAG: PaaI family thioesterase [Pseudomonadota bacterium]